MNHECRQALSEWIDENLASGWIRPSQSQYSCPVFFKDEGDKLCLIVDHNQVTVPINVPLPLIWDIFDQVKDLSWPYPVTQSPPKHLQCNSDASLASLMQFCSISISAPSLLQVWKSGLDFHQTSISDFWTTWTLLLVCSLVLVHG